MSSEPVIIERTLNVPPEKVWKAITDRDEMANWYFNLEEFRPEVGFEFQFDGGPPGKVYIHICKVTQVIPGRKISYTWRFEGYEGISEVSFELFGEGDQTKVRLTHSGIETFPKDNPDLAKHNFITGWTDIIGRSLKEFVEAK